VYSISTVKTDRLEGDSSGVYSKKSCKSWDILIGRMCGEVGATYLDKSCGGLRHI
jgi:hypothetical protein